MSAGGNVGSVFIPDIYLDVEDRVLSTCVTGAFLDDDENYSTYIFM